VAFLSSISRNPIYVSRSNTLSPLLGPFVDRRRLPFRDDQQLRNPTFSPASFFPIIKAFSLGINSVALSYEVRTLPSQFPPLKILSRPLFRRRFFASSTRLSDLSSPYESVSSPNLFFLRKGFSPHRRWAPDFLPPFPQTPPRSRPPPLASTLLRRAHYMIRQ